MSCGIYKITNKINKKSYIGQSKNIEHRWIAHKSESRLSYNPQYNYSIHKAFRKYGIENFTFEIIENTTPAELNDKEKYWIEYYDSYNNGYNETTGGEAGPCQLGEKNTNARLTEQDVVCIRTQLLHGKMLSQVYPAFQDKVSHRGFEHVWRGECWPHIMPEAIEYLKTEEYKTSVKKFCGEMSHKKTEQYRQDIAKRKYNGENRDQVFKDYKGKYTKSGFFDLWYSLPINPCYNNHTPKKKPVMKLDKDTLEIIEQYESAAEASRKNNCDQSGILKVCRGQRKSCGGFIWRYIE